MKNTPCTPPAPPEKLILAALFALFALLVTVGFYARVALAPEQLVDATAGVFRQDIVMTVYLQQVLLVVFTVVSVVLLAAAMSTLDAGARIFPAAPIPFANPGVSLSCALLLTVRRRCSGTCCYARAKRVRRNRQR